MSTRFFVSAIVAAAAALVLPVSADARSKDRQHRSTSGDRIYDRPDRNGWYPRDANRLRFGSAIWFDQMQSEGRFGGNRRTR